MKLGTFIILLIFVSGPAFAQEMAAREDAAAGLKFMADPELSSKIRPTDRSEAGIIESWRERVFKTFGTYISPRQSDLVNDNRLQNNNEFEEQDNESRMATRIVLKETLQFTRERLPEIDKLVKALRFEVSTDMVSGENGRTDIDDEKNNEARTARNISGKDRFLLKTGLRVPVESGKLVVASETEARYGNVTSFFTIHLDGQYDNNLGLKYVLGKDIHLQVERQIAHTTDFVTSYTANEKSSLNLVQLVCKF